MFWHVLSNYMVKNKEISLIIYLSKDTGSNECFVVWDSTVCVFITVQSQTIYLKPIYNSIKCIIRVSLIDFFISWGRIDVIEWGSIFNYIFLEKKHTTLGSLYSPEENKGLKDVKSQWNYTNTDM